MLNPESKPAIVKQEETTPDLVEVASPEEILEEGIQETDENGIHIINPNRSKERSRGRSMEVIEEGEAIEDMHGDDDRRACRIVPFGRHKRQVAPDDKSEAAADVEIDKKLRSEASVKKKSQINRRPPYQKVKARCRMCRTLYKVDPAFVPGRVAEDDVASFICDHCIPRR